MVDQDIVKILENFKPEITTASEYKSYYWDVRWGMSTRELDVVYYNNGDCAGYLLSFGEIRRLDDENLGYIKNFLGLK